MKCIDPLVTGYERGTLEERSARTESSPRQSGKNSEDDSRANNNIRETLGILSATDAAKNLPAAAIVDRSSRNSVVVDCR